MSPNYKNILVVCCFVSLALFANTVAQAQSAEGTPSAVGARAKSSDSDTKTSKIGPWVVSIGKTDKGKPQVEIRLAANEPYTDADATDQKTADFVIGCTTGQTLAFLDWKGPLISENNDINALTISTSLDDSPPAVFTWDVSSENTSLISKNSVNFIQSMAGKKRMEIQIQPDGMKEQIIVFSLSNLDEVLKVIGEQCYR